MYCKHCAIASVSEAKSRWAQKSLCMEMKLNTVKQHERGKDVNFIACAFGLSQFITSTVMKHAMEVKKIIETPITLMARTTTKSSELTKD